jgi:hypothetical protein
MGMIEVVLPSIVIGIGATAFMDIVAILRSRFWNIPGSNYAFAGRWIVGMSKGRFAHKTILEASAQRYERTIGWVFHYFIGVIYVGLMLAFIDSNWLYAPNLWNPMVIAIVSLAAPFLIMQPAFGFGFAASKTPAPWRARQRSLVAHMSFGVGIYITAIAWGQFLA